MLIKRWRLGLKDELLRFIEMVDACMSVKYIKIFVFVVLIIDFLYSRNSNI